MELDLNGIFSPGSGETVLPLRKRLDLILEVFSNFNESVKCEDLVPSMVTGKYWDGQHIFEHQQVHSHCSDRAKVEVKAEPERREWDGKALSNLVASLKCC